MTLFEVSYVLLWLLAIFLVLMSVVLLYLLAQLQERTSLRSAIRGAIRGEHLIGKRLPATSAKEVCSAALRSVRVFGDTPHVILALSPDCGMCRRLLDEIASMPKITNVRVLLLCIGGFDKCVAAVEHVQSLPVLVLDEEHKSTVSLRHIAKPVTLMVDESGIVVDVRHPLNIEDVMAIVRKSTAHANNARGDLVATG